VLCIVFALAFIEGITGGEVHPGFIVGKIISSFVLASIVGFVVSVGWAINFEPDAYNQKFNIHNACFCIHCFRYWPKPLGYSGAISSLVFGITLVNIEYLRNTFLNKYLPPEPVSLNETEKVFFSEIVFLSQNFLLCLYRHIDTIRQFTDSGIRFFDCRNFIPAKVPGC